MINILRKITGMLLIVSVFISGCALTACDEGEPDVTFSQSDQSAIYSAVIRQVYVDRFRGTYEPPALYLIRHTDDKIGDPRSKSSESLLISETVQSEITTALDDLPSDIIWVSSSAEVAKDSWGTVLDGGAIITIGNIHPKKDGSTQVPGGYYMAMDGGGGMTYVLNLIDGIWKITGTTGAMWIS